ncbi:hypothetical protein CU098_010155 [Rhizopus stolonifer]|uniref:BZIP domain-containing protein n=1 Tax=Rhizopus stolonifer TaxID=4846 RepID=A0A367KD57_RHIST|nr:hypothetical protein CU098_010155 [Rhizopus stolonifer]
MSTNSDSSTQLNQFTFQHFDQECDFGVVTEDGQCIRKRKKPGRKPNPSSTEKRRAQNRDSQRAYRQRESNRKQEFEKEKGYYVDEIRNLKKKLAQSEYEAKYLRAIVLHLTLSFLTERGTVPHFWANDEIVSDLLGSAPVMREEDSGNNPALLKVVLKNERIADLDQAMYNTFQTESAINCSKNTISRATNTTSFTAIQYLSMNKGPQQPNFPTQPDKMLPQEIVECDFSDKEQEYVRLESLPQKEKESASINNNQLTVHKRAFRHVLLKPPSQQTADDLVKMSPLQALHVSRLQLKISSIGELTNILVAALQKIVPHDIRIDYVPGHSIRDRMILFQDYYDMDECFNHLTQNVVFTGGDIRIVKNWSITNPEFSSKFWFISHEFIDQSNIYHLIKSIDDPPTNNSEGDLSQHVASNSL